MKKKLIAVIIAILSICSVPASAASIELSSSGPFVSDWMRHYTSPDKRSGFGYGFNTFLFNEDIINGCHFDYVNRGYIIHTNDNRMHYSLWKKPGLSSDYQVRHSGPVVKYGVQW